MSKQALEERLWTRVRKTEGCWLWLGTVGKRGYGVINDGQRQITIHRLVYQMMVGVLVPGMEIHHTCENRICCNPRHLSQVSKGGHLLITKGWGPAGTRQLSKKCAYGHEYDDKNTYALQTAKGLKRTCRTCNLRLTHIRRGKISKPCPPKPRMESQW